MSVKMKQLENGLSLLSEIKGLGDIGALIYVKEDKIYFSLPVEGIFGEGVNASDLATHTWVEDTINDALANVPLDKVILTQDDLPDIRAISLQDKGVEIGTFQINHDKVTFRCDLSSLATLVSPTFLGRPAAPEPGLLSDDDTVATTAFVKKVIKLVTGMSINTPILSRVEVLISELSTRYNNLSGTSSTLNSTLTSLLSEVQKDFPDLVTVSTLVTTAQRLLSEQVSAETTTMPRIQQLITRLQQEPLADTSSIVELLKRYSLSGAGNSDVNRQISTILNSSLEKEYLDDLIGDITDYLSEISSQRSTVRTALENYLSSVQDIVSIAERLLITYKALPSTSLDVNTAVQNLISSMSDNDPNAQVKTVASALEQKLRSYNPDSYGLTVDDKALQEDLAALEKQFNDLYDRVVAAATTEHKTNHENFFTNLSVYDSGNKVSKQVNLLLEQLAVNLETLAAEPDNVSVPTTIVQNINSLSDLFNSNAGFLPSELVTLLQQYRNNSGSNSNVTQQLSNLSNFLKNGDNNNGAATDTTAIDIINRLEETLADISSGRRTLEHNLQEEINKIVRISDAEEKDIIKTIKELSKAINNDPDFYNTITNLISGKLDDTGGTISGDLAVTGNLLVTGTISGGIDGTASKATNDTNGNAITGYVRNVTFADKKLKITKGDNTETEYSLPFSDVSASDIITYSVANDNSDGLMSKENFAKLKSIASNANNYSLPVATGSTLGGVKTGSNVTNINGTISISSTNIASALGFTPVSSANHDSLDTAVKGYVKSINLTGKTLTITTGSGTTSTLATQDTTYSIFTGATPSKAGTTGLVPSPVAGYNDRFLRGDGTWVKISMPTATDLATGLDLSAYLTSDTAQSTYAPIASPTFTGTPKAPTAAEGTNTTQIATTAFVQAAVGKKQPLHAALTSIAGLTTAANKMIYTTASNTYATTTLSAFARTILDDTDAAAVRTTIGALSTTGTAAAATKLETARNIIASLNSTVAASFNGTAPVTVGTQGTLPLNKGGTGVTLSAAPSVLTNLASTVAGGIFAASPRPGITGILPVSHGGTGATVLSAVTVGKANQLSAKRKIILSDGVTGTAEFDGSADVTIKASVSAKEKAPAHGKCTTNADVAAKVVTISDFTAESLIEGARIAVTFTKTNTAKNPTLNVSGTGAKVISLATDGAPVSNLLLPNVIGFAPILANRTLDFTYINNMWVVSRSNIWATSYISGIISSYLINPIYTSCFPTMTTGSVGNLYYGLCETAAGYAAKAITIPEITELKDQMVVVIHFRNGNTHANPTLNITMSGGVKTGAIGISGANGGHVGGLVTKIPAKSNVYFVLYDTSKSTSTSTVYQWYMGKITYEYMESIFNVNTAAATAAKVNTMFTPRERLYVQRDGGSLTVRFAETNSAAKPTLNINNYGAKSIFWQNGTQVTGNQLKAGVWQFIYDNTSNGYIVTSQYSGSAPSYISTDAVSSVIFAQGQAHNDHACLRIYTTKADTGALEIATGDNGNEPVYLRQYSYLEEDNETVVDPRPHIYGRLVREATLLDASGNTKFPGTVTATSFSGNYTGTFNGTIKDAARSSTKDSSDLMYNGYVNLGSPYGGLKLQWGKANFTGTNQYVDFTFPIAFTTACYSIMICSGDKGTTSQTTGGSVMIYTYISASVTKTKVRIIRRRTDSTVTDGDDWITVWAIGI